MLQGEVVESLAFEVQREKILAAHDSGNAAKKSWGRGARWAVKHQPQLLKVPQVPVGRGGVGARAGAGVAVKRSSRRPHREQWRWQLAERERACVIYAFESQQHKNRNIDPTRRPLPLVIRHPSP